MKILSIETSCDDTCISVIKASDKKKLNFDILSNIVSSQVEIHKKWGGVYPMLAKREHQRNLALVLKKSLSEAKLLKSKIKNHWIERSERLPGGLQSKTQIKNKKLKEILKREEGLRKELEKFLKKYQKPKIDLIAVTIGPGLEPCLWVGVNFAKALSCFWDLPIVPVNHIEAHILANLINESRIRRLQSLFPAICLIVSGGHTQLILMEAIGKYKILGQTRDDAAGECFDKTAKILGLEYPGGPAIAKLASKILGSPSSQFLPRPMIYTKDYDFSFSGLKTAVLYQYQKSRIKNQKYKQEMAKEIQQAIIDVLIKKTIKAAKNYKAKTIILGGGVAANDELRKQLKEKIKKELPNIQYLIPNIQFCTDNAAMVGITGYFRETKKWKNLKAEANLKIC